MARLSFAVLLLAALFALSSGCELTGKCRGGCRRSFPGQVRPKPCDLECPKVECKDNCPKPRVCTARYKCDKRCAYRYIEDLNRTFVRCWCVSFGTCGRCDCKLPRKFPWQRIDYTPF